ncbi:NAD(P)-dependent oxidoreductase [Nocardia sp. NBC_01499]|uniref:NAD(P)-dependent oxidoreductase n=1 Tax=Nocardia sp. NBC_01499 TaxID=2903597 RepID=UPI003864537C
MDIAVLGMGRMGQAIAGRLLDGGHQVRVWNRTMGKAGQLVSAGAREVRSVAEAVDGVGVAVTMVADDAAVRAVALGELRGSLDSASSYVDCSSVSPALSGELAQVFPRFVAMPMLGGPAAVSAGQAVLLVGGAADRVDGVGPMISSLSETVRRYDTAAQALTAKLTTNLLLLSGVVALAEAFAVGRSGGLADDQLRELLGASPVVAPGLHNRFDNVLTGSPDGWWTAALGAKDAGLALEIARGAGVELPSAEVVRHLYEVAASRHADADISVVTDLYRREAPTT